MQYKFVRFIQIKHGLIVGYNTKKDENTSISENFNIFMKILR